MLTKNNRLNLGEAKWRFRHADFETSSQFFKVLAKKNNLVESRVGFLVTGKLGKATRRNLARRRLAEAVQGNFAELPKGYDFIFILYPNSIEASYEKIRTSLDQVLPKISLLR